MQVQFLGKLNHEENKCFQKENICLHFCFEVFQQINYK